jgi:hypothetical protein
VDISDKGRVPSYKTDPLSLSLLDDNPAGLPAIYSSSASRRSDWFLVVLGEARAVFAMGIRKLEFYEGAAIHQLARSGSITGLLYEPPFFTVSGRLALLLKYSTRTRSPWGFTFMPEEQRLLERRASRAALVVGLICGSDGIAALPYTEYAQVAPRSETAIHVSCYRSHRELYEINGPAGCLPRKVAPGDWQRILQLTEL